MRPKRLISLLVAVCMMITMLPLSAVTAFAADTSTVHEANDGEGIYRYAYKENEDGETVTITEFLGPVDPAKAPALYDITIPTTLGGCTVTGLGDYSFAANSDDGSTYDPLCSNIHSVTIPQKVTSIGKRAFYDCKNLTTLVLGEDIKTIGNYAFECCTSLTGVTIPQSVTSIGYSAFEGCTALNPLIINGPTLIGKHAFTGCTSLTSLTLCPDIQTIGDYAFDVTSLKTVTLPKNLTSIGEYAFACCSELESITIPEKVKTINPKTFADCSKLEYIILPAGLTTFDDSLENCRPECVIYYKDYKTAADALRDNNVVLQNDILAGHNFLYLCKVTFDANGGDLTGKGGNLTNYLTDNLTDHAEVPVYKTEKITDTKANDLKATDLDAINAPKRTGYKFTGWYTEDGKLENGKLFNVKDTAITDDITLYARWEFDPNALVCHPLTVTGGTVTVKYDGSDVTSKLNSRTDATTGQKTYYVPDNATVTVKLDKTAVPNGKVFDGWSTSNLSLLTGQDYKAESITFRMSSDANVSAKYRDAATDHTPGTAVCHPLTVTGGIVTVKNGDKDVTDTLTVTTDETTGKKTYSVPDGATVTVTLDKTLIPEGMVFDIWSTGKFSLPLGQDYKAESITFTMNTMSSDADIAAQYRDATIEDDEPNVLGTAAIIGTAAVGGAVLGYQAYSLGAEFAGKLMALPYFPSNRSALAMMLWEDAGKPMPESELLYPDVEQEEQDMDLQHAARWAMENELIPDLNDEGTAPEEMKFFPANPVSKLDVLNAWQKAQELKNN
ncbi:leucine-rich repeat protein [Faecalibacterium prausnitzii]|uniref:leucine-rich repeat protein n=1 Tax=Faecalibacterium prausnitzii TaxID=853 RepID=UPI0035696C76